MVTLLAATALAAGSPEWRAALGGQFDADPHGIVDVGWRHGPWSVELLTDTVDARWSPEGERGRAWVGLRAQGYAGQMLISPWEDGAPAPEDALLGLQAGPDGGAIRYLPHGLYVGGMGAVRGWAFARRGEQSTAAVPDPTVVATADALLGWWRESAEATVRLGADLMPGTLAPHAVLRAEARPTWVVAPWVVANGVVAANQGDLLATRVGGLTPYVVPVAGAAWAEWWAEDVAAVRAGPRWQPAWGSLGAVVDAAWFDGDTAVGFAGVGRWSSAPWSVDLAVGVAPWIPRQPGIGRTSGYLLVSRGWQ